MSTKEVTIEKAESTSTESDAPPPSDFFFKKRGCTDICCVAFFVLFWGGMGYLTYLSYTVGDPNEVFYGMDYLGNRCGMGSMVDKPKIFYPRMDQDIIAQADVAATMPWRVVFYGLCMSACPNVTTPQACFDNPASCRVDDYGTVDEYTAAGGSPFYYATMPSIDLMNRCIPSDSSSLQQEPDRCAFPQCDGVNYAPCDETYPTTWVMSFPKSLQCQVKFQVGKIEKLAMNGADTATAALGGQVAAMQQVVTSLGESQVCRAARPRPHRPHRTPAPRRERERRGLPLVPRFGLPFTPPRRTREPSRLPYRLRSRLSSRPFPSPPAPRPPHPLPPATPPPPLTDSATLLTSARRRSWALASSRRSCSALCGSSSCASSPRRSRTS
jgi:hypothetical protein